MDPNFEKPGVAQSACDQKLEEVKEVFKLVGPTKMARFSQIVQDGKFLVVFPDKEVSDDDQELFMMLIVLYAAFGVLMTGASIISQNHEELDEGSKDEEL